MSSRAPQAAQRHFHRNVALLFAVMYPTLAIIEISRLADMASPLAPIRWATYLILAIWSVWLTQREDANALPLTLSSAWFFGALSVIEGVFRIDISAFDFATTFGLVMMLGVLAGALSAGSRVAWALAVGFSVAAWSVVMGLLLDESGEVMAVRAIIAVTGVVFTTALVSKLYDQLSETIRRYDEATRLQQAIAKCSEALLIQTDTFAVYEALKALLEATAADYVYVDAAIEIDGAPGWQLVAEARRRATSNSHEWLRGAYPPDSAMYMDLSQGRASLVSGLDLVSDERGRYERGQTRSEVAVPIFVGGVFRGSIGFVEYRDGRHWSEDEMHTLWRASHMISAYWRRQDDQAALRFSNESKDRLLASVSHELRTPLTAIVGLSEEIVASRASLGDAELDELNDIIAVQGRELAELVEDLLVASRVDFGSLSIHSELIDLRKEVEAVVTGVRESHRSGKTIVLHGESVLAWADGLRCRQIIRNLLTNAVKYGGNRIVVAMRDLDDESQVLVVDDGAGVRPDEADLIFERYYRSHASPTQPGSVGIGLAVSRQLAEMMGGKLEYLKGEGGARFSLTLPAESPPTKDADTHQVAAGHSASV